MPDSKRARWPDSFATDGEADTAKTEAAIPPNQPAANDADGWQQYRHWITKAPALRGRRVGIDPSLYTWKGYRAWSDQVKRTWSRDTDDESQ